jgi:hypothetical protein
VRRADRLQVVVPSLLPGSGGHRTILTNVRELAARGVDISVHLEAIDGPPLEMTEQRQLAESLVPNITSQLKLFEGWASVEERLPVMATAATSAGVMARCTSPYRFYFIQDRESHFNPAGYKHLAAEQSYLLPASRLAIGRWIPHFLRTEYDVDAVSIPFGVDDRIYGPRLAPKAVRPRLAALVQPEKPRRFTELLLRSLELLAMRRPDVEIVLFGSDHPIPFDPPAKHLGLIPERAVAYLYNTAWAGVCLSASNPSRAPFEMVRCGLRVIDILAYNTLFDYPRERVGLVYPGVASLANAMEEAIDAGPSDPPLFSSSVLDMPTRQLEAETFAAAVLEQFGDDHTTRWRGALPAAAHPSTPVVSYDYAPDSADTELADAWLKTLKVEL